MTLITSLSKKVPLIEAVRKAASAFPSFSVIHGTDREEVLIGKYFVDHFWPIETLTFDHLLELCQREKIRAILPTRDGELPFFAKEKERFKKAGIAVLCSSLETVELVQDKLKFAEVLNENGFPAIPTFLEPKGAYKQWVVKERFSTDSREKGINLSLDEAIKVGSKLSQPIFQPYLAGKEFSIDVYGSYGLVVRERNLVVGGESQITTTVEHPKIADLTKRLAAFLKIEGHAVFQGIETPESEFSFLECNPRFGGASTLAIAAGLDTFTLFYLESLGKKLPLKNPIKIGLCQIRFTKDLIRW